MAGPSVLVIGASGNLGRPLIDEFINNLKNFSKVGILSSPSSAHKFEDAKSRGIQVVIGSFTDPAAYSGFEITISLAGDSLMRLQPAMIDAAVAGGVTHFYPSEFGSDTSMESLKHFRYFQDKRMTRTHLVATAKQHPEFKYTYMLTGPFTEFTIYPFLGVDRVSKTVTAYGDGNSALDVTSVKDVVRYTVYSTLLPFQVGQQKREIRVVGERTTFQRIVDTLGEVEGCKYSSLYLPVETALVELEAARVAEEEKQEHLWSAKSLLCSGNAIVPGPLDNEKLGVTPAETVKETFLRITKR